MPTVVLKLLAGQGTGRTDKAATILGKYSYFPGICQPWIMPLLMMVMMIDEG